MRPTLGGNDAELGLKKRPKTNKLDKKYDPTLSNYQAYCILRFVSGVGEYPKNDRTIYMVNTELQENATKVHFRCLNQLVGTGGTHLVM